MLSTHFHTITLSLSALATQQATMMHQLQNGPPQTSVGNHQIELQRRTTGTVHYWRGVDDHVHVVPYGFRFPSYTCFVMWQLWFFGNAAENICPYKSVNRKFDLTTGICKTNQSRTKGIMNKLVKIAINGGKIQRSSDITQDNHSEVFDYAYPLLLNALYACMSMCLRDPKISTSTLCTIKCAHYRSYIVLISFSCCNIVIVSASCKP